MHADVRMECTYRAVCIGRSRRREPTTASAWTPDVFRSRKAKGWATSHPASASHPHDTLHQSSLLRMPASQDDPSFSTLDERARSDDLVFRVYTEHSASPLVWTGTPATSGFFAPNGYLSISPSVYTRLSTGGQSAYSLVDGPYGRHSLVDHILGKEQQTCILVPSSIQERDSIPEDDKSCWISCTRSLTWAIWEAARRIATEECLEVHVSLITRKRQEQHTSGGESKAFAGREISVVPGRSILAGLREGRAQQLFSMNTREAYEIAARQATESEEVLYYGRIFAESIEADLVFTRDVSQNL